MITLSTQIEQLQSRFCAGENVLDLLKFNCEYIDQIIQSRAELPPDLHVYATGGYGREEMYPYSDIDLLIISDDSSHSKAIELFIQSLWDHGFKVGHSVRTSKQCRQDAMEDLFFLTALLETRPLSKGAPPLSELLTLVKQGFDFEEHQFLNLKLEEQFNRHEKYEDNLEPHLKNCPGGLRDLQLVVWIARFYFGSSNIGDLIKAKLLSRSEYLSALKSYSFIAELRFALHLKHQRPHDVLHFDDQKQLSIQQGFRDKPTSLAVEQFMKQFYRQTANISIHNELFIQSIRERVEGQNDPEIIDDHFQWRGDLLDIQNKKLYRDNPQMIFKTFLQLSNQMGQFGFTIKTLRALRAASKKIDSNFRNDPVNQQNFLAIFDQQYGVTRQLIRMSKLGILSCYLPAFGEIKGHMQFDLFHRFTVDVHTLNVIKELRKIRLGLYRNQLPFASDVFPLIDTPRLLYLAAFFHDLGKGRNVDHSIWGAAEIETFGKHSGCLEEDIQLMTFLVSEHLLMSLTAQKMDLSDPGVIKHFAKRVGNMRTLNYLYLLTVADIRATNIQLWNGWKDSLLRSLYLATRDFLENQRIRSADETRNTFVASNPQLENLAQKLNAEYWLTFNDNSIDWQLNSILNNALPMAGFRQNPTHHEFELLLFTDRRPALFAHVTAIIDSHNLSIAQAQFYTTPEDQVLCYFVILNADGSQADGNVMEALQNHLQKFLNASKKPKLSKRRRRIGHQHFDISTRVKISIQGEQNRIDFFADDRPGLLAEVGEVFANNHLIVHQARISTLGARVEDAFYVTGKSRSLLSESAINKVQSALLEL